jgi:hypothetical protein
MKFLNGIFSLEMEFLDINLKKDSSLLLHSIDSLSTGEFFKENQILLWF